MTPQLEAASWRDPSGFVVREGKRVLRAVVADVAVEVEALLNEAWFQHSVEEGLIPRTTWIEPDESMRSAAPGLRWLEHQPVWFPAFPHEITPQQLFSSAQLTLKLAERAAVAGWVLKDASAWNVLHGIDGACFVDVLSFRRFDGGAVWAPYAQFFRHFIIPLLLYRDAGIEPHRGFLHSRHGVTPETARGVLTGFGALRQPALEAVTLPALLGRLSGGRSTLPTEAVKRPQDVAQFLLGRTLSRLRRQLARVDPGARRVATVWADYEGHRAHYTDADLDLKRATVREFPGSVDAVRTVLDLGCNAGEFSFIAADAGKQVVAVDADLGALAALERVNGKRTARIHPMVLDLGNPTPAYGWLNTEVDSFLARAAGFGFLIRRFQHDLKPF